MSRKMKQYSTEFKTKIVLEVLQGDKTLNEIASVHNIIPKNIMNWKKIFLDNAEMAMEPAKVVKEYKNENKKLQEQIDEYAKKVGKMTVENEWLMGKLKSLDLLSKKDLVQSKLKNISITRQTELLGISRSSLYYTPIRNSIRYVASKNHKEFMKDLKPVYQAVSKEVAEDALLALDEKWGKLYPIVLQSWNNKWENLSVYFKYPPEIRKVIYTTNIIESVHRQFRCNPAGTRTNLTKTKGAFLNEDSLLKLLYMGIQNATKKWNMPIWNWNLTLSQLAIFFEGRLDKELKI